MPTIFKTQSSHTKFNHNYHFLIELFLLRAEHKAVKTVCKQGIEDNSDSNRKKEKKMKKKKENLD